MKKRNMLQRFVLDFESRHGRSVPVRRFVNSINSIGGLSGGETDQEKLAKLEKRLANLRHRSIDLDNQIENQQKRIENLLGRDQEYTASKKRVRRSQDLLQHVQTVDPIDQMNGPADVAFLGPGGDMDELTDLKMDEADAARDAAVSAQHHAKRKAIDESTRGQDKVSRLEKLQLHRDRVQGKINKVEIQIQKLQNRIAASEEGGAIELVDSESE